MNAWERWVAWCARPVDARPAALVRIALPSVVILDQARLWALGLVPVLYRDHAHGGLLDHPDDRWYLLDDLFGSQWGGPVGSLLCCGSMALAAAGVAMRPALLAGVFLWGQLAHGFPGDNGGDRIARTALLILAFSGADRRFSLRRSGPIDMPSWPADLVRWLLCLVYLDAGLGKLLPRPNNWLGTDHVPITYRILAYPLTSRADPAFWWHHLALFRAMDVATIAVELSSVLLLTRWRAWWGLIAAPIHLGILLYMQIDVFAALMLGLYPLVFDRWITSWAALPSPSSPGSPRSGP